MAQTPTAPTWLDTPAQGAAATITAEVAQAHDGSPSTDHAFVDEAARAANLFRVAGYPLAVLESTSAYPVAPQEVGLKVMQEFAACYR